MGSELYDVIDANDRRGASWEVGATHDHGLALTLGPAKVVLYGELRDRYAEAVARAVTPGNATPVKVYYECCIHCEHNGETDPDLDDERHPNPCPEGCRPVIAGQVTP